MNYIKWVIFYFLICFNLITSLYAESAFSNVFDYRSKMHFLPSLVRHTDFVSDDQFRIVTSYAMASSSQLVENNVPISVNDLNGRFPLIPQEMIREKLTISLLSNIGKRFNFFLEVPFTNLELSILYKTSPNSFSIQSISSKGLSDIHFGLVSSIFDSKSWRILGGFGFYIDTGDVTLTDSFPIYLTQSLGYPLQHGSGSFDLSMLFSVNYTSRSWSFGYALMDVFHLSKDQVAK